METEFSPLVKTETGMLQGQTVQGTHGSLAAFYGVPYAEAPVGELRWRSAQPKHPWEGILHCNGAITEQKSAYQWGQNLLEYFRTLHGSEDCLYLNITSPALQPDAGLPVFVWFHGGGLFGGSGSEEVYNLPCLPEKGCVLVTVTTRLGALGILAADLLEPEHDTANFIISDMLAALHWIRENIQSFGGDPGNVTIAGESGGAHKVSALLAVPQAKGLFQRAVIQSGIASACSREEAGADGSRLMEYLNVHTAEEARQLPAEQLVSAYNELNLMSEFVIDGQYLQEKPADAIAAGRYNRCPVLVSVNAGELTNMLPMIGSVEDCMTLLNRFTADGCAAWACEFDQVPGVWRTMGFKCVHSLDLAWLFGAYDNTQRFYSGGPWEQQFMFHGAGARFEISEFIPPVMDEADRKLSDTVMELWLSFARTGVPACESVSWARWTQEEKGYLLLRQDAASGPEMAYGFDRLADAD